jgi:hypothetical protein
VAIAAEADPGDVAARCNARSRRASRQRAAARPSCL